MPGKDSRSAVNSSASAGYSGTPQLRKLGIASGTTVAIVREPDGWTFEVPLPDEVTRARPGGRSPVDIVLSFVREPDELGALEAWGERIFPSGAIWVAWPRKAAGHQSEVTENLIRDRALALGLVDVKVAAIDTDWSGLKVVWRRELRDRSR